MVIISNTIQNEVVSSIFVSIFFSWVSEKLLKNFHLLMLYNSANFIDQLRTVNFLYICRKYESIVFDIEFCLDILKRIKTH